MCAIAGIFAYAGSSPPVDRDELLRIREAMVRRGPDGDGLWISPGGEIGLAHRRLAIIDLSPAAARDGMKVALSGIGGDELFGGYPGFRDLPLMPGILRMAGRFPAIGRGFRRVSAPLLRNSIRRFPWLDIRDYGNRRPSILKRAPGTCSLL